MKTYAAQPKITVKAGSVSLSEARAAARAAKTGHYLRVVDGTIRQSDTLWERYLGHFGGAVKKATGGHVKAKTAKKTAAKRVKVTGKKASAKKHSAKKTSAQKR